MNSDSIRDDRPLGSMFETLQHNCDREFYRGPFYRGPEQLERRENGPRRVAQLHVTHELLANLLGIKGRILEIVQDPGDRVFGVFRLIVEDARLNEAHPGEVLFNVDLEKLQ